MQLGNVDMKLISGYSNFDLYYSSNKKVGEPPTKIGGQSKLVNFVPESIVPNIVECFSTSRKAAITCSNSPRLKLSMMVFIFEILM